MTSAGGPKRELLWWGQQHLPRLLWAQGAEQRPGLGARAHPLFPLPAGSVARHTVNLALGVLVAWLSIPVVLNLLSPRQVMNSSFNPLRIVNTYGAFGRYLGATMTPGGRREGEASPDLQPPSLALIWSGQGLGSGWGGAALTGLPPTQHHQGTHGGHPAGHRQPQCQRARRQVGGLRVQVQAR